MKMLASVRRILTAATVYFGTVQCVSLSAPSTIDDELARYVRDFESHYGEKLQDVSVVVDWPTDVDTPKTAVGMCWIGFVEFDSGAVQFSKVVYIKPSYYRKIRYDQTQLELTVFHELGHCVLGLEHDNAFVDLSDKVICTEDEAAQESPLTWYNSCMDLRPRSIMLWRTFTPNELRIYRKARESYIKQLLNQ